MTKNYVITRTEMLELAQAAYDEILEISPNNYTGAEHAYNKELEYWEQFDDQIDWER